MPYLGTFHGRVRVVSGWRAALLAVTILAVIALVAFVALGALVIIVPVLIVASVISIFLPKHRIFLFTRSRRSNPDGVIDGEYQVAERDKIEQTDRDKS